VKQKPSSRRRRNGTKSILRLPNLDHAKAAVLNSLNSMDAKRGYRHAIDEFVDWYCSEPRLAFNRIVVLRYRSHLESRQLAPGTINLRLGAVRRLAYEAADCGLLSADLAAGIRRVRGVKKLGIRLGFQFLLGHVSVQTTERYLECKQRIRSAVNDLIGIEPTP
jgi:site-specific recombinase XerD